ncbi:lipoprotein [Rhizocola hellebori]|uniref:Lipoprotein n=1 Tax=Rhizocola hellebori TaxID=1392758 RepID=A0A8J3QK73_9ACTN|nr:DUF305 domain-containing protein [Rhizocola hellebori]GIH11597.1 lipoprotein [Rhizocola hellebori]
MWTSRRAVLLAAAAVAVLGSGGYALVRFTGGEPSAAPPPRVVQPGAPGQTGRTLSPQELARMSAPPHTLADTLFFQRMIPHHAQALQMTALVKGRTVSTELPLLAERISVSQQDEITQMRRWLTTRGEPQPQEHTGHAGHDQLMPGMLNDEELARLAAAQGAAFDRLFLEFMIRHHEGALVMVQQLSDGGGGIEPDSDRFAREVRVDQSIEIRRMRDLLAALN